MMSKRKPNFFGLVQAPGAFQALRGKGGIRVAQEVRFLNRIDVGGGKRGGGRSFN